MDGLVVLLFLGAIWLFLAPFCIMGKIGAAEERLNARIEDLKAKLNTMAVEVARFKAGTREAESVSSVGGAPDVPPYGAPEPPEIPGEFLLLPAVGEDAVPEVSPVESEPLRIADEARREITADPVDESLGTKETEEISFAGAVTSSDGEDVEEATVDVKFFAADSEKPSFEVGSPNPFSATAGEPGVVSVAWHRLFSWLLAEGNIWVCAGVLLFFVGFGLLFSYAIQIGLLTLEMRLAGAAAVGLGMAGLGFRLRERRRAYGLILQGGGMGVLYLVVLAATKFNSLSTGLPVLPAAAAVVAMLVLSLFTVMLALLQDYQPLALFAVLGGFVAPPLVSTGSHNHVALFAIYTLLNFEILMLAFRRNWRLLNRMGFLLTVGIGTAWGMRDWRPELFLSVEPFLVIFLATYTLIAIRAARQLPESPEDDGARCDADLLLAVCTPFSFFLLQTQVAGHFTYGMAVTCLGLGLWYLAFGAWLLRGGERYHTVMPRLFISLCILFSNLVVPYAFENVASSAIWAVEGAFLIILASRCGSYKALLGGVVLHVGALILYSPEAMRLDPAVASRLSPIFVSGVLFALAHWGSGFWATRFRPLREGPLYDDWERWLQGFLGFDGSGFRAVLPWVFTVTGSLWWWWTIGDQIPRVDLSWLSAFSVACVTASVMCWMSVRFEWRAARCLLTAPLVAGLAWTLGFLPFRLDGSLFHLFEVGRNLWLSAIVYVATIGTAFYLLRGTTATLLTKVTRFVALFVGLMLAHGAMEQWGLRFGPDWARLFSILPLLGTLLCLPKVHEEIMLLLVHYKPCLLAATGLPLLLCLPAFIGSFSWKGSAVFGVFVPVLNPLELWQGAAILAFGLWIGFFSDRHSRAFGFLRRGIFALLFIWINQVATRGTWWYTNAVYYDIWSVLRTPHCQGVIAILWGILGLAGILRGQKLRDRLLWRMGAGLLAVDMIKLLLFDLNRAATLTRILAFLVLGGLFLLIGWAAPLPPKKDEEKAENVNDVEEN